MKRKWRIGTIAALGAFAAAFAFGGLSSARADELSDLQTNVQALQKEVAQLQKQQASTAVQAGSMHAIYRHGSFLLPGTNTSIAVGGYVKLDAFYWLNGGPVNGNMQAPVGVENGQALLSPLDLHGQKLGGITFNAPIFNPNSRGNGVLQMTARESRLRVATSTPTAWGPVTTFFEFDWLGCNNLSCNNLDNVSSNYLPRLRHAGGTFGPWLFGQFWGLGTDLEAGPETIDFGGPLGEIGKVRIPQIRYTWKGPIGISAAADLEEPHTTAWTPQGQIESDSSVAYPALGGIGVPAALAVNPTKATWPVVNAYWQWDQPWGHLRLYGVLVPNQMQDGRYISQEYLGYGGGPSGNFRPGWFGWSKDNITFQFEAGNGMGDWLNGFDHSALATNYGGSGLYGSVGGPTTAAAASLIHTTTVTEWGGVVGYQHWWFPNIRSTAYFGMEHQDVPINLVGPVQAMLGINKELMSAGVNLLWSPVAFVNTGVEWDWAQRQTVGNAYGEENILEYEFQVMF